MNEDIASLLAAIDSMRIELEEMRAERDEAYEQIDRYKNGYEGGCHACEIVAVRNQELLAERDEARRIACLQSCMGDDEPREWSPEDFANQQGWDCFKEDDK